MRTRATVIFLLSIVLDLIAILLSLVLSAFYSISPHVILHSKYTLSNLDLPFIYLLACFIWYFSARSNGLYGDPISQPFSGILYKVLKNILIQSIFMVLILFSTKTHALTRTFVLIYSLLLTIFILIDKTIIRHVVKWLKNRLNNLNNIIIVGATELGRNIEKKIIHSSVGNNVIGYIDDNPTVNDDIHLLGKIKDFDVVITKFQINMVIVALTKATIESLEKIIGICQNYSIDVKIIPDLASYYLKGHSYSFLGDVPVVSLNIEKLSDPYWQFVKRTFDIVISSLLFITIFSWMFPVVIILQKIFNPGTVFFKSNRSGKGGVEFTIYKFRSMQNKKVDNTYTTFYSPTSRNDKRVTNFGKFLRKTSLDELPQFINVLKGEMSIIGPRPFEINEAIQMKKLVNNYKIRQYIKPGITGWAQINGYRGGTKDLLLMQKRIDLDNWYINNWSLELDIQIILTTMVRVVMGDSNAY